MEESKFCIDDDIEGNFTILNYLNPFNYTLKICFEFYFKETPKNSPARVAVSESTTVDLGKFSQSSSSLVNDHLTFQVSRHYIILIDNHLEYILLYYRLILNRQVNWMIMLVWCLTMQMKLQKKIYMLRIRNYIVIIINKKSSMQKLLIISNKQ